MSWKDWTAVYELSDMWLLNHLRQEAVDYIIRLPRNSDEWVAALRWSTMQHVLEVRAKAIQQLDFEIREIVKIELAKECNIVDWLLSGYLALAERYDEISAEEEDRLGRQTTSKLFRI